MPQQYKIDKVGFLKKYFEESSNFIFTNYRGLNVEAITDLRKRLSQKKSIYVVIKNNYLKIIAKEKGYPELGENAVGPTSVVFTNEDTSEILKLLFKFSKDTTLKIKGGLIDGSLFDNKQLESLSKLPGRNQLIAMFMSTLNAPLQNFVYSCNDIIGRLVRVLNAVAESKKS